MGLHVPTQKIIYDLRVCGQLVECRETWNWNQTPSEKRGECREPFSAASRLRMLKEIAQIHWRDDIRYSLITLTYPDALTRRTVGRQTLDRSRFTRDLERLVGTKISMLWRKEWKHRLTGVHKGKLAPHWHLLCFRMPWVDHRDVRKLWRACLAHGGRVATDVREASSGEQAAVYAAKYAAKRTSCSLDYATYLNTGFGRAWGFVRKHLISYYKPTLIRGLSEDELALATQLAQSIWPGVHCNGTGAFTIFTPHAANFLGSIQKKRLARTRQMA